MVIRITCSPGCSCLSTRVAARPSRSGMCTSISTTSGCSWRQTVSASWPLAASPTISAFLSQARILRSPARARSWSSTITTRVGGGAARASWRAYVVTDLLLDATGQLRHDGGVIAGNDRQRQQSGAATRAAIQAVEITDRVQAFHDETAVPEAEGEHKWV